MIKSEFADSDLFVVKDPRLSRLLPLWFDVLDELGIEAVVVIPFRNPLEVAASLKARDRMSLATSLILYAYSYLDTELVSADGAAVLWATINFWRTGAGSSASSGTSLARVWRR